VHEVTGSVESSARRWVSAPSVPPRARACGLLLVALLTFLSLAGSAQAAPSTTVSLTFDDGRPSQLAAAQELANRGMKGTFFIISAEVGRPGVMTVNDLNALEASGMEIGAHTVSHRDLPTLTGDEATRELCLSRNWLMDRGFDVYDMAYPHDSTSASVKQLVAACGYNSARAGSALGCDDGDPCAETVPPLDAYQLRTPNDFNNSTTLAQMKAAVTNAESNGGGWVPLELHDVCNGPGDPLLPPGAPCNPPYVITRALYTQFLDWLKGEVDAGRVQVKTVHEVVGGALKAKVAVAPAPVRTGNLLINPSFEAAGTNGLPSSCWANVNNGPDHPPSITTTSDAHEGAKALAITVPNAYDSWATNLIAPVLDLAQCSPSALPGHHYTFTGWYKGNGPIKVVAYWRNADYQWTRLDWGALGTKSFPAAAAWTKASFTFQAPAGTTAVSAGFSIDSASRNHSYTIDDTSLADDSLALAVSLAGAGTGSITSNPAGIACGATCQASFASGTNVTLAAAAAAGSSFTGWSGACSGTAPTCTLAMTAARSATATFTVDPPPVTPPVTASLAVETPPVATAIAPAVVVRSPVAGTPAVQPRAVATAAKKRPLLRIRPKLHGRAGVGRKLVCSRGTWTGRPRYAFTWLRGGKVVGHGASYLVRKADRGHAIRCVVIARNANGASTAPSGTLRVPR
jgi:peptidoglycan/xylan/chitin deacetylase (PgdA/CDA1 family)